LQDHGTSRPGKPDDDETALVDRAGAGDPSAFAALYDRHLQQVFRHVYYRVGHRDDAEDLSQQVFLQAWRAMPRYKRTGAPFVAWLLTIAHNEVIAFYRKARTATYFEVEPEARDLWSDPEARVLSQFDRLAVRRAILQLKPEQQQVVIMRFVEHLDLPAIAAALGKKEGNIRVIQHRALNELRRLLAPAIRS